MEEQVNTPKQVITVAPVIRQKRVYETDGKDRAGLALALGLGILLADLLVGNYQGYPGLGITLLVLAWEGVMFWYAGGKNAAHALKRRPSLWLTAAVVLLALCFAVFSSRWFWFCNICALPCLMVVQMFEVFGNRSYPWSRPIMLCERALLLLDGLLDRLPASLRVLTGPRSGSKRMWYVLGGLAVTLPLLGVVLPLLASADQVFNLLAGEAITFLVRNFGSLLGRLLLGALLTPPLFGLLYLLRRPGAAVLGAAKTSAPAAGVDPALSATVLALLNLVYLLFVGVQFRALFGGADYLAAVGLSYAEYARSGFFQLVWVSCINLAVVVAAVQFSAQVGRLWRAVQGLSSVMVVLSGILLVSAAWRMSLYVGLYGLSFKRFLTYWGMGMLVIFFTAAVLKIWRKNFSFFRVLFAASVAGWLLLNAANVDAVVSRYNVNLYLSGNNAVMDLPYLAHLSYSALPALEDLDGGMTVYHDSDGNSTSDYTLENLLRDQRTAAAEEAASWRTWTLSAQLAAE